MGRLAAIVIGSLACTWAVWVIPSATVVASARDISTSIGSNYPFKLVALNKAVVQFTPVLQSRVLHPEVFRADALVASRIAEESLARGASSQADAALAAAEMKMRSALQLIPAEPYLWLALYSSRIVRVGPGGDEGFLTQSYAEGPFEGWIALRRNRLALAAYPSLDEPAQRDVVSEFGHMVGSGFIDEAAANLTSVGWSQRAILLQGLERVDIQARQALAKNLVRDGFQVRVPGVEIDDRFLWR